MIGSLAAMSIFESEYQENMDEEGAKALVAKAIRAGKYSMVARHLEILSTT